MANGDTRMRGAHDGRMDGYLRQLVFIRAYNDALRTQFRGGTILVSETIKELGDTVVAQALLIMAASTDFDDEEHGVGHFIFCSRLFRWEISYGGSPNPANAKITRRTLYLTL